MIFHCPACRALASAERAELDTGGTRVGLRCPECGETTWLPTGGATDPEAAPPPQQAEEPVDDALGAALRAMPASAQERELAEAFLALRERQWDEQGAHRALLRRAAASEALPTVGLRYRKVLEHSPDDVMAKWGQQEIIHLAMASITPERGLGPAAGEQPVKKGAALVALGVGFGLLLLLLLLITRM